MSFCHIKIQNGKHIVHIFFYDRVWILVSCISQLHSSLFPWAGCPNIQHYLGSLLWMCVCLHVQSAFVASAYVHAHPCTCVQCVSILMWLRLHETNSPFSLIEEVIMLTKIKYIKANKPQILSQYSYTIHLDKLLSLYAHSADAAFRATPLFNDSIEWSI